ncbi:hypothetical protein [Clostridium botulinum]|uniref:hypothetical protein n=1 Tax=Clostridium botulinum TaxID=1491 RepID=UPI001E64B736|nr:hypothetical protein [Clostridium botulinum]MCD3223977.1 hypothetical protein [Clostridium botulinum C/D]MCD3298011.1 hypothetical protein [Clostridium botulinum C/D]
MLTRTERGSLRFEDLSMQCFMIDLFQECKNRHEVEWLSEQLRCCLEVVKEDTLEDLEKEE